MFFGRLLIAFGVLALVHAGYYSIKYEEYVRLLEVSDAKLPPVAVIIELVVAFVLSLVGVLIVAGEVQPIRTNDSLHSRSLPAILSVPDFHVFSHRGKALHKRIVS
ncbi:hypothetical protein Poli38472_001096 [Pythium oligandrum]|uniref:Membrane magnesium transporter n=1 Tax=Pythium oligandrum TaxID=41045 RepID=A0A8K1FM42_PYTOL|nr:hypothetical protein Poli38472_001096 [Pythium oligandrum]|eukprot:TMW68940.1 hypothetical protein Poli38472_001096 [Pythium oligandrum]